MKRTDRARLIGRRLDELYPDVAPPLSHEDPFTLLVAVVLSAQCTDKRVNEVSPRLFALASTPQKMAALSAREIERVIRPCGLGPGSVTGWPACQS